MDGKSLEYKGEEALQELENLTEKADEVQEELLNEILTRNRETEYLKKHMDGSTDRSTFKLQVPVVSYDGIRPYIQRIANGEDYSLISAHPITEMLVRYLIWFTLYDQPYYVLSVEKKTKKKKKKKK